MKIVVSGGHITPVLALSSLAKEYGDHLWLVGREYVDNSHQRHSREKQLAHDYHLSWEVLNAPKFTSSSPLAIISALTAEIKTVRQAQSLLSKLKPDIVVSFGGYVGFPLILAGRLLRLPTYIHEQTTVPGLANRLAALLANRVGIGFAAAHKYFPKPKTVLVGNPIRTELLEEAAPPQWFHRATKPLLFVTAGNLGSQFINSLLTAAAPSLSTQFQLVIQSGDNPIAAPLLKVATHRPYLTTTEMAYFYHQAQAVICRGGANTVSELLALRLPAVVIPLPISRHQEQLHNATELVSQNLAVILPQNQATPQTLIEAIAAIASLKFTPVSKASVMNINHTVYQSIRSLCPDPATI